jgi:cysteinyl-tRNA synthetase
VYVAFDVLYRLLRQLQYDVQYVRNFTDVDDKIIKRAAESGEEPLALAGRFITEFHEDMAALGCLPPTVSTTQHTPVLFTTPSLGAAHPGQPIGRSLHL